jgi:phosphoribosyl-AMP cyclohydrolase (EC 3.5.4.19)
MTITFDRPPSDKGALEVDGPFTPKFDANGLVTAVVTDAKDGELLMVAHMDAEALGLTLETGIAHYFSRSRNKIWKKGETSGNLQHVREVRVECDQDAVWLKKSRSPDMTQSERERPPLVLLQARVVGRRRSSPRDNRSPPAFRSGHDLRRRDKGLTSTRNGTTAPFR